MAEFAVQGAGGQGESGSPVVQVAGDLGAVVIVNRPDGRGGLSKLGLSLVAGAELSCFPVDRLQRILDSPIGTVEAVVAINGLRTLVFRPGNPFFCLARCLASLTRIRDSLALASSSLCRAP